jgi:Protein of unknown function (DUF5818)
LFLDHAHPNPKYELLIQTSMNKSLVTLAFVLSLSCLAFSQQEQTDPNPAPTQTSPTPTQPGPAQTSRAQTAPSQGNQGSDYTAQRPSQTLYTGTVISLNGKYVLKTDRMTYELDDQERAKQYEGREVKVTGTVDQMTSVLHISDIEPVTQQ